MKFFGNRNLKNGMLALLAAVAALSSSYAAQAAVPNSTQLYRCSGGASSLAFQQVTSQNKQFMIGTSSKIVAIAPNAAGGTLGALVTPPTQTFSSINWCLYPYNNQSNLQNMNAILCFNNPNGSFFTSVFVPASSTVAQVAGNGWYQINPSLPANTVGKVLTQITFQYNGNTTQPIQLGRITLNGHSIGSVINTALLGCQAESCGQQSD
ncbi:MAG: hypothetical protein JST89_13585 [Cyanobacteria bacterium SZAS-4]|nr:hypothetical protein [Cyanobacteria bacterium SZAS-4]